MGKSKYDQYKHSHNYLVQFSKKESSNWIGNSFCWGKNLILLKITPSLKTTFQNGHRGLKFCMNTPYEIGKNCHCTFLIFWMVAYFPLSRGISPLQVATMQNIKKHYADTHRECHTKFQNSVTILRGSL